MNLEESPGFLLNKLAHQLTERLDKRLQQHGVSISQWAILALLWSADGLSQYELQQRLGVQGATITGLLNRMARLDLILRRKDESDRRIQRIFLTPRARSLERILWREAQEVNEQALSGFSPEEKALFLRLIIWASANLF